jgi:small neutral amino acid transporter SnatA (MarC family)
MLRLSIHGTNIKLDYYMIKIIPKIHPTVFIYIYLYYTYLFLHISSRIIKYIGEDK